MRISDWSSDVCSSDLMGQPIKFYQTGTFTVGNRLLKPAPRTVQASIERSKSINTWHRACQGCGEALGASYAVDAALRATGGNVLPATATGCVEVFWTPYPDSCCHMPGTERGRGGK